MSRLALPSLLAVALFGCGSSAPAKARYRLAHLAPDVTAPAVDVCVKRHDTPAYTQPYLKSQGLAAGLAYAEVTDRVDTDPGSYDFRIVAANAADCSTTLDSLADLSGVQLTSAMTTTVAAIGLVNPGSNPAAAFQLMTYTIDDAPPPPGKANFRALHASPDTPHVDLGFLSGQNFISELVHDLGYPSATRYAAGDPFTSAVLGLRLTSSTPNPLTLPNVNVLDGWNVTAYVIGNLGGSPQPLQVIFCEDNQPVLRPLIAACFARP